MKTLLKTLVLVSLSTLLAHAKPEPLFDGKSLDGWRVDGAAYWTVKDGVLVGKSDEAKKGSILWTQKEYGDFVYETEFRFNGVTDSGVFLRHLDDQIQIGISGSLKRDMTGSPYIGTKRKYPVEAEGVAALLKEGVWNKFGHSDRQGPDRPAGPRQSADDNRVSEHDRHPALNGLHAAGVAQTFLSVRSEQRARRVPAIHLRPSSQSRP